MNWVKIIWYFACWLTACQVVVLGAQTGAWLQGLCCLVLRLLHGCRDCAGAQTPGCQLFFWCSECWLDDKPLLLVLYGCKASSSFHTLLSHHLIFGSNQIWATALKSHLRFENQLSSSKLPKQQLQPRPQTTCTDLLVCIWHNPALMLAEIHCHIKLLARSPQTLHTPSHRLACHNTKPASSEPTSFFVYKQCTLKQSVCAGLLVFSQPMQLGHLCITIWC